MEILRSVATEFIRSYKEHKQRLPQAIENAAYELVGPKVASEVSELPLLSKLAIKRVLFEPNPSPDEYGRRWINSEFKDTS